MKSIKKTLANSSLGLGLWVALTVWVNAIDFTTTKGLAERGSAKAEYSLGEIYYEGKGVPQDSTRAKEWYGKSCNNGEQDGCNKYKRMN